MSGKTHLTRQDIEGGLRDLGLCEGDIVLLHSSLSAFGLVDGGAPAVVQAFLEVLGDRGTLVVPIFGALGVITDVVREDPRAVRSLHPLAAVAAIGADAEEICHNHWKAETAHGPGTPYTRIAERGGYVCLAGVDQDRNTTLHTAEAMLELPYLTDRTMTFTTPDGEVTRTIRYFPGPHRDFIGLDHLLREAGVMRIARVGKAVVRLVKSRDLIDVCLEAGRADPAYALCDNARCADCVTQRAAIRRDRFSREPFTLAAASGLAGRAVPEMLDNLRACGIEQVELDLVGGRPAHRLDDDALKAAVEGLRDGGCTVAAVRCASIPEPVDALLDRLVASDVPRVVLPLSGAAREHAALAAERGLSLSLCNGVESSPLASRMLLELREAGSVAGFTFSPAHFVRAGEKPFLSSFNQKVRRFIDQLDVEDACPDGTPRPLGQGNAEIKEMISILCCASFDGLMVLTSENRPTGTLPEVVARFEVLLDEM